MNEPSTWPIREDLARAHDAAWERLGRAGTWLDGKTRLAVALEAREALHCTHCQALAQALSPATVAGEHTNFAGLDPHMLGVVHRIRNDAARISQRWVNDVALPAIGEGAYVETIAVVATVLAIDGFHRALGWGPREFPGEVAGEPSRRRPLHAQPGLAWVPTLAPGQHASDEVNPYRDVSGMNIHRALSLVPDEAIAFFELDAAQYLPDAALRDYGTEYRALTHPQIELLAARVSAINQCVY